MELFLTLKLCTYAGLFKIELFEIEQFEIELFEIELFICTKMIWH